jgi:hypothetical protein
VVVLNAEPVEVSSTVTAAPGTASPIASVTKPLIDDFAWPKAMTAVSTIREIAAIETGTMRFIGSEPPWT